jgi:hypothetical protein
MKTFGSRRACSPAIEANVPVTYRVFCWPRRCSPLRISCPDRPRSRRTQPTPASVTIAGSLQSELGCPGDWQPDCVSTHLHYDVNDDVWQGSFVVPSGNWEYKAPLNDNWTENYGLHATSAGANIPLELTANTVVKFYYDHKTHWVTDNQNAVIATAAGSFPSELGCPGDCSRSMFAPEWRPSPPTQ